MEEQYKGHVIRITTEKDNSAFSWKPICRILDGTSREFIKQIDWRLGYDLALEFAKTHDEEVKAELEALRARVAAMKGRLI